MDNPAYVVEFDEGKGKKGLEAIQKPYTFEEAITLTKVGKFQYGLLVICGICFMSVMIELMSVGLVLPLTKCDLESTITEQGLLASACFFGIVMSSHIMGFLADTWGRVQTLRYALFLSAVSSVVSAFSVNIWMLIVFRFFTGFFIAGGQACIFSLCGEFHGMQSRTRFVTLLSGFLPIGLIYLPAIASAILPWQSELYFFGMLMSSWRFLFIANASFTFLGMLGLFIIPETPKYVLVQGDEEASLKTLRKVFSINTGLPESEYPVNRIILPDTGTSLANIHSVGDAVRMVWSQTVPLFNKERIWHTLSISVIMFVAYGMAQGIFVWFPTIFNEMYSKSESEELVCETIVNTDRDAAAAANICDNTLDTFIYNVLMVIGCIQIVFYLLFAFTIDFIGKKNLAMGWMVVALISVAALHWASNFYLSLIWLTLIMCVANVGAVLSTIAMEYYPTSINAMGMCFIMMIGRLGAAVGSNFIGPWLFNSCNELFWVLTGILCVLTIQGYFLPDKRRRKNIVVET